MKIIFCIPLVYCHAGQFWNRDLGLVVLALREIGINAWFCTLKGDEMPEKNLPLLLVTRREMSSTDWWFSQKADAIVLNTWSAPRHELIRRAALSAGCPLIEKLDTDGVKSPRIYPWHHLRAGLIDYDRRHLFKSKIPRKCIAAAKTCLTYVLPSILDRPMVRCMERIPVLAAETPIASARVRRLLKMYDARPMPRVVTIPHPVDTTWMGYSQEDSKRNRVVAVGRWDMAVKGWPLLARTARLFLERSPDWEIVVIGPGAEAEGRKLEAEFPGRFKMLGRMGREGLAVQLRASKIYLLTSHLETFNIAGAEALCCGCSVVGPAQIPSSSYFAGSDSGSVSYLRSSVHLTDALMAEVDEWDKGNRDPYRIAEVWKEKVGAAAVSRMYLDLIRSIRGKESEYSRRP